VLLKRYWFSILLALILGFVLTGTAFAQTPTNSLQTRIQAKPKKELKTIEGTWNLRLRNFRFEDDFNQKNSTYFRLAADLQYQPLENVTFRLAPKFDYENGYTQAQEETTASSTKWGVKEASINAEPFSEFLLSAGALDQGKDHPALLLVDQAFPAIRIKYQSDSKARFSAGIKGESAIPTSSSLSTQTKEFEKTPSYNSGSLFFDLQRTAVEGSGQVGVYQYQNLPTSIATKSGLKGNSTEPTSGTDSIFKYDYQGTFARGKFKTHLGKYLSLLTLGEWAQNQKAPSGYNQAVRAKTGAELNISSRFQLTPFYEYFRIEPDAIVSHYNGDWLNSNRLGYSAGLEMAYRKTLKISLQTGERDVVYESPTQHRERTWLLTLETFDVAI